MENYTSLFLDLIMVVLEENFLEYYPETKNIQSSNKKHCLLNAKLVQFLRKTKDYENIIVTFYIRKKKITFCITT